MASPKAHLVSLCQDLRKDNPQSSGIVYHHSKHKSDVTASFSFQNIHKSCRLYALNRTTISALISVKTRVRKAPNLPEPAAPPTWYIQMDIVKLLFVFQNFISIKVIHVTVHTN